MFEIEPKYMDFLSTFTLASLFLNFFIYKTVMVYLIKSMSHNMENC